MGKKYIIELPENTHWIQWIMEGTKDHHPYVDFKQVEDLTPYTEDSAYAHGYTEAESKYREIRDELEKDAYQRGLNDAWECARKFMSEVIDARFRNNFMVELLECDNAMGAMKVYSASEAVEKIRQYEQEQKQEEEQVQVGDEIEAVSGKAVVVYVDDIDEHKVRYVYSNGVYAFNYIDKVAKTGRHFPEIAEVLRKMKEES